MLIFKDKSKGMEHKDQKSWFGRNWLWVVPVGGCLTVILLFIFGLGTIIFGVSKALKSSTPYEYAVERAISNTTVLEAIGENIETDGILQGNIALKNNTGSANLKIPIKGDKDKGTIIVEAEKQDEEWTYKELYVSIKSTQEDINLLNKAMEDN